MARKFRVFTEVKVIVEKEIEADSFDEAADIARNEGVTAEEVRNGEFADDCVTGAEDIKTGELVYFNN